MKSQTHAQIWDIVLPRVLGRLDLALYAADAEASRNQNPVSTLQKLPGRGVSLGVGAGRLVVEIGRLYPVDYQLASYRLGRVLQRLDDAEV